MRAWLIVVVFLVGCPEDQPVESPAPEPAPECGDLPVLACGDPLSTADERFLLQARGGGMYVLWTQGERPSVRRCSDDAELDMEPLSGGGWAIDFDPTDPAYLAPPATPLQGTWACPDEDEGPAETRFDRARPVDERLRRRARQRLRTRDKGTGAPDGWIEVADAYRAEREEKQADLAARRDEERAARIERTQAYVDGLRDDGSPRDSTSGGGGGTASKYTGPCGDRIILHNPHGPIPTAADRGYYHGGVIVQPDRRVRLRGLAGVVDDSLQACTARLTVHSPQGDRWEELWSASSPVEDRCPIVDKDLDLTLEADGCYALGIAWDCPTFTTMQGGPKHANVAFGRHRGIVQIGRSGEVLGQVRSHITLPLQIEWQDAVGEDWGPAQTWASESLEARQPTCRMHGEKNRELVQMMEAGLNPFATPPAAPAAPAPR